MRIALARHSGSKLFGERLRQRLCRHAGGTGAQQPFAGSGGEPGWWDAEPGLVRVVHGMAHRVDRIKALGNGQVPAVVALAWRELTGRAGWRF